MQTSLEGLWHYSFGDKQMNWSQGMFSIFRPKTEIPIGLNDFHFMVHPLDRFKWELAVNQASLGGAPSVFDSLMVLPDGHSIWVRHRVSSFVKDGKAIGLEGICSDVTELKIREMERKIEKTFSEINRHKKNEPPFGGSKLFMIKLYYNYL